MQKNTQKKSLIILSLLIFIISLSKTAFSTNGYNGIRNAPSIAIFVNGSLAVLGGGFHEWLIWLANPIYFTAIYFFIKDKKKSKHLILIALIIGLSFTQWKEILGDAAGNINPIVSLEIGYWLWIISMVIFYIGTIIYFSKSKSELKNKH